ncbi:MAG TPA: D-alanyl-D-alanine carboxypeptidase/D-alanyl-D-alanine-endopeptidase [Bacteroidales bacterium]|nr:D-alanyl-D-alanine carboxypeptidase/D-alanyl-D-alanine-endopeptidase [Bacteroidales bacterium]
MKNVLLVLLFHVCLLPAGAQNTLLRQSIDDLKSDPYLKQSNWGVIVFNCEQKKVIEEYNADSLLIPASIVKLTSTSTALDVLGDTFRFVTRVYIDGEIGSDSVLHGDLNIVGGADPTIGFPFFTKEKFIDSLYAALTRSGIKTIEGNVNGYAGIFDSLIIPDTYPDDDRGNYYGAGTAGLIWDGNALTLSFNTPATFGAKTTYVSAFPAFEQFVLENKTTAGRSGTGDNSIVWGDPFDFTRIIDGTLPPGKSNFEVYGSTPDPALGFALAVRSFLEKKGITFSGTCSGQYRNNGHYGTPLISYYSQPLSEIIQYTNNKSYNVSAETCLKMSGLKKYDAGTWECGLKAVYDLLGENSVQKNGMELHDGSGLSKANRVSPKAMGTFLMNIRTEPWFETLYASLPIAGESGTLKTMFEGTPVKGKLRAKSGYMKTVRAYAGYVPNQKNEMMAFCIIVNNYSGNAFALKKKLEKLMVNVSLAE